MRQARSTDSSSRVKNQSMISPTGAITVRSSSLFFGQRAPETPPAKRAQKSRRSDGEADAPPDLIGRLSLTFLQNIAGASATV